MSKKNKSILILYENLIRRFSFSCEEHYKRLPITGTELVSLGFKVGKELSGHYNYDDNEAGRITIYRPNLIVDNSISEIEIARQAENPLDELIIFAHEIGHHRSALLGTFSNFDKKEAPECAYAEEARAWAHGRQLLQAFGFKDWDAFDQDKYDKLEDYQQGLGLPLDIARKIENEESLKVNLYSLDWYRAELSALDYQI